MLAGITFVLLGIGFFVLQSRIARLDRILQQVVDEVQRQRDLLAGKTPPDFQNDPRPDTPPVAAMMQTRSVPAPAIVAPQPVETAPPPATVPEPVAASAATPEAKTAPDPVDPPQPEPRLARIAPPRIAIEELLGSKLPIWAGGITLVVAGLFIVKYSIDVGLLSPAVRVVLALVFAAVLVVGGEVTRRWRATAIDPRVSQSLAGAGIAVAYAAILMAANVYRIVDPALAFVGLTSVTVGALGLALRFGAPCAVLGLVGGLAAPALVGGGGNVATLAIYLTLTVAGLAGVARHRKWRWLSAAALLGGFGWGGVMLAMQMIDLTASLAIGVYLIALAFAVPFIAGRDTRGLVRLLPPALAAGQLAILIVQGGYAPLIWGFYGLLAVGTIVLARIDAAQRLLPPMALAVGIAVIAVWPMPPVALLAAVLVIGTLLFAGDAVLRIPGGDARDAAQLGAATIAALALGYVKIGGIGDPAWAAIATGLALPGLALAWQLWRRGGLSTDLRFVILIATALVLLDTAVVLAVPALWWGPALAALAVAAIATARSVANDRLAAVARIALAAALMALIAAPGIEAEIERVAGDSGVAARWLSALRLSLTALAVAAFARGERDRAAALLVEVLAALIAACALAQLVPGQWLAIANLGAALAVIEAARVRRTTTTRAATFTFAGVAIAWTLMPLAQVAAGAVAASLGIPLFVTALPVPLDAMLCLLAPAVLLGAIGWRLPDLGPIARRGLAIATGILGLAGLFVLWKQMFAIDDAAAFVARGMAERVALTTLLFAGGWAAWRTTARFALARPIARPIALALTGLALARTIGFEVVLYNPLWVAQQVGAWPVVNLLAPAFLLPLVWLALVAKNEPARGPRVATVWTGVQMALVLVLTAATVRQLFNGSILTLPGVSAAEDIARSLVAIAAALGFLAWGIRVKVRSWRIASLALMLAAITKVFVFDASGLEGLMRIASFVALGLSLIGIGWVYSRYLASDVRAATA